MSADNDTTARWSAAEVAAWTWLAAQRGTVGGWVGFNVYLPSQTVQGVPLLSPRACRVMDAGCESLCIRGYLENRHDPQLGLGLFYRPRPEHAIDVARSMAAQLATVGAAP